MLPADVPGFIVLPRVSESNDKLTQFARKVSKQYDALEIDDLVHDLGLLSEDLDTTRPITLVFTKPTFEGSDMVVAFHPMDIDAFMLKHGLVTGRTGRMEIHDRRVRVVVKGDVVFASRRLLPLRVLRNVDPASTVMQRMDELDRAYLTHSEAVVHLNLKPWRNKISPMVSLVTTMMQLGIAAEADAEKAAAAREVLNWIGSGASELVRQMESITLSIRLTDDAAYIEHRHRFEPGGNISRYLGSVTRESENLFKTLPNRPFWMVATSNWRCPPGESLTTKLTEFVMTKKSIVGNRLTDKKIRRVISDVRCCYGQMKGTSFMLSSQKGMIFPMEMVGSYVLEDASQGVKQIRFIQENANEALGFVMPCGDLKSKFVTKEKDGFRYDEMHMDFAAMGPMMQKQMEMTYGPEARFQNAIVSPTEVIFCMAEPPTSVVTLAKAREAGLPTLAENDEVRKIAGHLQQYPNVVILFDLDRLFAAVPDLAAQSGMSITVKAKDAGPSARTLVSSVPKQSKTLLGWSCVVKKGELTGRLAIDAEDAASAAEGIRSLASEMKRLHVSSK